MSEELNTLSHGLTDDDPLVREESAQGLAELNDLEAAPFLLHALDDDAEMVRMWGAYGLGRLRRPEDAEVLRQVLLEDDSSLVRLWAAFGLAQRKDRQAAHELVTFLDAQSTDVRNNAADAILSLDDASSLRPALERRLASSDPRARVWAAGVLHPLGHPEAFELWRAALLEPQTRADAAVVAEHLEDPRAAELLLRLLAELSPEELDSVEPDANDVSVSILLSTPLPSLGLEERLERAREDGAARADLLSICARNTALDVLVQEALRGFLRELPPKQLGQDVVQLLAEQDPNDHPLLLSNLADAAPSAVHAALDALEPMPRETLFEQLVTAAEGDEDVYYALLPLLEVVRDSRYQAQLKDRIAFPEPEEPSFGGEEEDFESDGEAGLDESFEEEDALGDEPLDEDDGLTDLIERMAAGEALDPEDQARAQAHLDELQLSAKEYLAQLSEDLFEEPPPPEPHEVAARALAQGGLLQRLVIEQGVHAQQLSTKEAKKAQDNLASWMEREGLLELLEPHELELFDTPLGEWEDGALKEAAFAAEELATLLWALTRSQAPAPDRPVELAPLFEALPLLQRTERFLEQAQLRDEQELAEERERTELWAYRVAQEQLARAVLSGQTEDFDEVALLEDLSNAGYDVRGQEKKLGRPKMLADGARHLARASAQEVAAEGRLRLVDGDLGYRGKPFHSVSDKEVELMSALTVARSRGLEWLLVGQGEAEVWDEEEEPLPEEP